VQVSVVVPLKNERDALGELTARIVDVLGERLAFELILVDDGSDDDSWSVILELCAEHREVRAIRQRRNFGKAAALRAGLAAARGDVVVTMDGDLQDDPDEIPRFLAELGRGFDVVSGWKRVRHDPLSKRLPSRFFNWVVRRASGLPLHDFNCGFKAYSAQAADVLTAHAYGEMHRYLPVLLSAQGFRVGEIEVRHHARPFGSSHYGVGRMLAGGFDLLTVVLLTRFRYRPLHAFGGLGAAAFAATALLAAGLGLAGEARAGLATLALGVLAAVALVATGLICELIVQGLGPAENESRIAEAVRVDPVADRAHGPAGQTSRNGTNGTRSHTGEELLGGRLFADRRGPA